MKEGDELPSLKILSYASWNDTDGKDETTGFDETTSYNDGLDASIFFNNWIGASFLTYKTVGVRISNPIDLSMVESAPFAKIFWTEIKPVNTSVLIETSIDNGVTWDTCTNGGVIPKITFPTVVSLLIKQTLSTTNELVTPEVSNVVIEIGKTVTITNLGHTNCYPIISIEKNGTGEFQINNLSDANREFKFTSIPDGRTVDIYNEDEVIVSSQTNEYLDDQFNDNFLYLVKGANQLQIAGTGIITFIYDFKYK